ncbi:MAG: hypothetical protein A3I77_03140 [Gammaproteobacteria bacterium RIFCSPLOWO2_02_FULL_42_14]|nr:MAG: hypothetical protein A2624_01410 [Gammaproteobacteria bacterium RIFCSPHIGHO2_01_FULL_42_8]OGT51667.1 MAG: hypothetical protein A3E54_03335 [Gammaproteobacteria bacterium RIFCSPHIGHO2_12_FULL_41_25]OGT61565.1 MAG: hypothetical protein A3I77_03140 [Gammaproteobacteria bacterium RIFCSPLOWO2_02_FULL_42_14]OGT86188.1 MAG: hypothetical protein A3G86_05990 [Gammaproteobacteria bacterium RIFCSPLOWO2_12_FULL_42_18]
MIVVVMLAILGIIFTPAYIYYFSQNRLKSAAEKLYSEILLARTEAIKTNSDINIIFTTGANWCFGTTTASSCNCNIPNDCLLGQTSSSEFTGVTMPSAGFPSGKLTFDGARAVASAVGSVTFTSSTGESIIVNVNRLGTPSICSNDLGDYGSC